jgi:hypothetical protein
LSPKDVIVSPFSALIAVRWPAFRYRMRRSLRSGLSH